MRSLNTLTVLKVKELADLDKVKLASISEQEEDISYYIDLVKLWEGKQIDKEVNVFIGEKLGKLTPIIKMSAYLTIYNQVGQVRLVIKILFIGNRENKDGATDIEYT